MGIDDKVLERIFESLQGIGLTVCRSIMGSHGGSLRASANRPYGTIFEVVAPADSEDADE